jgi:hypothetical protein
MDSDDPEAKAKAEIEAIQKSETNPGVLLASGYIAGGSLAGVILAFFAFSDTIPKDIARWQYSTIPVTREATVDELGKDAARFKLGASAKDADVISFGKEISELSREEGVLQKWVKVPAGTKLKTPDKREILIDKEEFLGPIAERIMGREYFAPALFQTNANLLKLPEKQRLVFNMKYFEELPYEEMSKILGTSVGALKASYHHAVQKIKHSVLIEDDPYEEA